MSEEKGVYIPQEAVESSKAKKKARRTLRQLPIYRDASNLVSMVVDLYDAEGMPKRMTKYIDSVLLTVKEGKKCIGLAEASRDAKERAEYLKIARVLIEDVYDDIIILSHKNKISKEVEKRMKAQAQSVVAQCVAWRDYTNDQGASIVNS